MKCSKCVAAGLSSAVTLRNIELVGWNPKWDDGQYRRREESNLSLHFRCSELHEMTVTVDAAILANALRATVNTEHMAEAVRELA